MLSTLSIISILMGVGERPRSPQLVQVAEI
jgi:hypothetical protein